MKSTHTAIVAFENKKQELTEENIVEIKSDIVLFQKSDINICELTHKLKIIISQFNPTTKYFGVEHNYVPKTTLPFISNLEAKWIGHYDEVWDGKPAIAIDILQPKRKIDFDYREQINDYDKEVVPFGNVINKLFGYICADTGLKNLITQASRIPKIKEELEDIELYKNIKFSDFRCAGTIFDKLEEYFIDDSTLKNAAARDFDGRSLEGKDKKTISRLKRIIKKVARKQREIHLLKTRKIGANGEVYCSGELLKYQIEKDIEQQEFIDSNEVSYVKNGIEQRVPLSKFALTDVRKAAEIYMKVKDLEKVADTKGYIALFTTFTCPAEFHSNPATGRNCWDGSTPRQASDWLSSRLVALNKDRERHEIETLGMWCKEAHKDQCIHMHSMFFVHPSQATELITLVNKHYSHSANAVKIVRISDDEAKKLGKKGASPASYITKYVIKSLTDKSDESMKNKAVARLWGFRMFNFFGKTKTTLWRTFDRFFDKEPHELKKTLQHKVFIKLAQLRKENRFWEFCAYANEFVQSIIVEHEKITWSGFEYIKKIKWGYRVTGTGACLQTKFECSLKRKMDK